MSLLIRRRGLVNEKVSEPLPKSSETEKEPSRKKKENHDQVKDFLKNFK